MNLDGDALLVFVSVVSKYPDEEILTGLTRCAEEIRPERGFVTFTPAILLGKMGIVTGETRTKAEGLVAWSQIAASFWTCSGACGCGHQHMTEGKIVGLSPRAVRAYKMLRGAERITTTRIQDMHYVKAEFLELFEAQDPIQDLDQLPPVGSEVGQLLGELSQRHALSAAGRVSTEQERTEARAEVKALGRRSDRHGWKARGS